MRLMCGARAATPNVKVEFVSVSHATENGRKTVVLRIHTDSLSVSSEGSRKRMCTSGSAFRCMNNRVVVRSLVTPDGCLVAMDDGLVQWRPHNGTNRRIKLDAIATVMLVVKGPTNRIETAIIGDAQGGVTFLTLPLLDLVDKFTVEGGVVRSMCSAAPSETSFLVATQAGQVWMVGPNVPGRGVKLFTYDGPVSSLRLHNSIIHIQSGWHRATYSMDGSQTMNIDGTQPFTHKAQQRANRRAKILESQQRSGDAPQPLMLDLPVVA
jgi:hypothetical protein